MGEKALFIPAIMQFAHRAIGCVENFCSSHFNSCNEAWSVLAGHAPPHVARSADGEFLVYAFVFTNNFHIPHIPSHFPSSYCLFLLEGLTLHDQGLKAGGVLVGDVDAMLAAGLGAVPPASLQPAASSSSPVPGVCALRSRSSHWCRHARRRRIPSWLPPSHSRQCLHPFAGRPIVLQLTLSPSCNGLQALQLFYCGMPCSFYRLSPPCRASRSCVPHAHSRQAWCSRLSPVATSWSLFSSQHLPIQKPKTSSTSPSCSASGDSVCNFTTDSSTKTNPDIVSRRRAPRGCRCSYRLWRCQLHALSSYRC